MSNVETVQEIYAAFGSGDIPGILERLAEDVEWDTWSEQNPDVAAVPWLKPRRGRDDVADFFAVIGQWEVRGFDILSILDGGDKVAAQIEFDMGLPGDVALVGSEIHLWEFDDDGRVAAYRHYIDDTAGHITAAKQSAG